MGALDGVRVLDVTVLVQGPQAGQMLADLGADVVKVELPAVGDIARWIPLSPDDRRSAYFYALNRGKRSITLDLRTEGGRAAMLRLVATADVLLSNFKPGTLDEWGLGYEALSALNPRLIYAAGSTFGPLGPEAEREGADLSGQAAGGLISAIGEDGSFPSPIGAVIADHCGAQNLLAGTLAALYVRERTGRGQCIEGSLLGGQVWAQASEITHYLLTNQVPGRSNRGHPLLHTVYRIFATADGHIAIVGAGGRLWPGFCRAIERPDLAADPRYNGLRMAREHLPELFATLEAVFKTRTTEGWCARLHAEGQRFAPVQDYAQVAADPQVWANGYLAEAVHPEWGKVSVIGSPLRMSETPMQVSAIAPELGQHTEDVLLEAGFSWEEIGALREQGAF